ncbi:hypothetical protein RYX36_004549 [Vicia faba]
MKALRALSSDSRVSNDDEKGSFDFNELSQQDWGSAESLLSLEYPSTHVYSFKAEDCDAKRVSVVTFGVTPVGGVELATHTPGALQGSFTPEQYKLLKWEKDIEERNRLLIDEDPAVMSPQEGYTVLDHPTSYVPYFATPTSTGIPLYQIPDENSFMSLCRLLLRSLRSSDVPPISIKLSFNSDCFVGSSLIRFYSQYGKKICT